MQWLILLLIYPHTLHSAIAILNCPSIPSHHIYSGVSYDANTVELHFVVKVVISM